ncbi:cation:proton antiporter [Streptomyces sp. NPDC058947]|uniref:cation:proton antiporter domain-containing protein n=1 Tax=Streptomyces sp. NPDC058947 TaxID=3346675 RepID=UPI00369E9E2A
MSYDKLVIVLAVAAGVPFLLALVPRVPLPGPVIEIVAGVVLGPAVLNVVQPDATVQALSIIGLSFLLFLAGLEVDFKPLRGPWGEARRHWSGRHTCTGRSHRLGAAHRRVVREPAAPRHRAGGHVSGTTSGPDPRGRRRGRSV